MKKSRNRKTTKKHNKSFKFRGGNNDNSGYVLAGFDGDYENECDRMPIFLLKEKKLKNELPKCFLNTTNDFFSYRNNVVKKIFLQVLYDLNYRGLDIFSIMSHSNNNNIFFYDGKTLIYPRKKLFHPEKDGYGMNEKEQAEIRKMELKYPGLFQRIFITKKEENDALEQLGQTENTPEMISRTTSRKTQRNMPENTPEMTSKKRPENTPEMTSRKTPEKSLEKTPKKTPETV